MRLLAVFPYWPIANLLPYMGITIGPQFASTGAVHSFAALRGLRMRDRRSGFTLFELLTTIVLIGIILAFSYPKLQYIARTASLRGARGAMITAVNVAKTSAIASGKCSYLKITSSAVRVFTTPCSGGTQIEVVSDRNFSTDYGVTVTLAKGSGSAQSSDSLGFDPRGIPLNTTQSSAFTLTKADASFTVTVGNYGRVQ